MTDPAGGVFQFAYDANNNLISVTYPDGGLRGFLYGEPENTSGVSLPNALTGIVDENGSRFATWSYDALGRAISSEHAGGSEKVSLVFNADGSTSVSDYKDRTDTPNATRKHLFQTVLGVVKSTGQSQPGGAGCSAASSAITYDPNGNIASRTDFNGNVSCYGYDLTRNLETRRVEGMAGANCTNALSAPPAPTTANPVRTVSTAWHPQWRLEARRAEPLKLTTWVYNGQPDPTNGNATAACAPAGALLPDGSPIAVLCKKVEQATSDATGSAGFAAAAVGAPRVWQYTYSEYGQMLGADGPRTDVADITRFDYWPADAQCPGAEVLPAATFRMDLAERYGGGCPTDGVDKEGAGWAPCVF